MLKSNIISMLKLDIILLWIYYVVGFLVFLIIIDLLYDIFSHLSLDLLIVQPSEIILSTIPLFIYDNVEYNKVKIWNDNKGKSGVYKWINSVTGSYYIGSSVNLNRRIKCYLDPNYIKTYKHKSIVYSAILKYGLSAFRLEILEHCSKEEILKREQFYLDTLKPDYNILKLAGSSLGFKHSYLTILQMRKRNKNNHPFLGKKHSKESKLKMSVSSRLSSPVEVLDLETGKEFFFTSNVKAAKFLNTSEWTIRKYKKDGTIFRNKWSILAVDKNNKKKPR